MSEYQQDVLAALGATALSGDMAMLSVVDNWVDTPQQLVAFQSTFDAIEKIADTFAKSMAATTKSIEDWAKAFSEVLGGVKI